MELEWPLHLEPGWLCVAVLSLGRETGLRISSGRWVGQWLTNKLREGNSLNFPAFDPSPEMRKVPLWIGVPHHSLYIKTQKL